MGVLVTCEHRTCRVTRTEYDGRITVLADRFDGRPLNSPNDVVVRRDGSIWFSDPPFGILSHYEGGGKAEAELPTNLYRLDPQTGDLTVVANTHRATERALLLTRRKPPLRGRIRLAAQADPCLRRRRRRASDHRRRGLRRLLGRRRRTASAATSRATSRKGGVEGTDGVMVFAPDATPIGRIALPERCANLCFGGAALNRLFMAASQSVYAVYLNIEGVATC